MASLLTRTLLQPRHPERSELIIFSLEDDEDEPAPLAPKKVCDQAFNQMTLPTDVYIY